MSPTGGGKGYVRRIQIETPRLGNNLADAQRLEQALAKEIPSPKVKIPWHILKTLPSRIRAWDHKARAILFQDRHTWRLVDLVSPDHSGSLLGAAIDIGTTKIALQLIDLESGQTLGEIGFDNPQRAIGPDVLERIHYSVKPGGLDHLQGLVMDGVNHHLALLCQQHHCHPQDIYLVTGAGNTAMTHLFLGIEAYEIIREPYIPCVNLPDTLMAVQIGLEIHEKGLVFLLPNIGSYFGGDLVAGILFADLDKKSTLSILVDVGTNAEIVVGNQDWLLACAGAAGPALEGGVSKMGMTAGPGVIDQVTIDPLTRQVEIHTIDGKKPLGICGSGMIDLASGLFLSGMMDIQGKLIPQACGDRFTEMEGIGSFVLVDPESSGTGQKICLSQVDLNSLTSSKAAMYTILEVIVKKTAGLEFEDLETFYVAGTFGSFIKPASAISIGMLPDIDPSRFKVLGNSSLGGAALVLKDPDAFARVMEIQKRITYMELNVNQEFMNLFSGAKFFPHTDRSRFPSVFPHPATRPQTGF